MLTISQVRYPGVSLNYSPPSPNSGPPDAALASETSPLLPMLFWFSPSSLYTATATSVSASVQVSQLQPCLLQFIHILLHPLHTRVSLYNTHHICGNYLCKHGSALIDCLLMYRFIVFPHLQ